MASRIRCVPSWPGQREQRPAVQGGQGFLGNGQFDQRDSFAGRTLKDLPEPFDIGFRLGQPVQERFS